MPNDTYNEVAEANASWIAFCFSAVVSTIIGIISILANALVMYVSSNKYDATRFQHINWVVKNLAINDFIYCLIGVPLTIVFWWWGKQIFNYLYKTFLAYICY